MNFILKNLEVGLFLTILKQVFISQYKEKLYLTSTQREAFATNLSMKLSPRMKTTMNLTLYCTKGEDFPSVARGGGFHRGNYTYVSIFIPIY